jgi:dTDP-glucose pyrophosphorylase
MIYYPLSVLMLVGIRNILIITTPVDGSAFTYGVQQGREESPRPSSSAQSFLLWPGQPR